MGTCETGAKFVRNALRIVVAFGVITATQVRAESRIPVERLRAALALSNSAPVVSMRLGESESETLGEVSEELAKAFSARWPAWRFFGVAGTCGDWRARRVLCLECRLAIDGETDEYVANLSIRDEDAFDRPPLLLRSDGSEWLRVGDGRRVVSILSEVLSKLLTQDRRQDVETFLLTHLPISLSVATAEWSVKPGARVVLPVPFSELQAEIWNSSLLSTSIGKHGTAEFLRAHSMPRGWSGTMRGWAKIPKGGVLQAAPYSLMNAAGDLELSKASVESHKSVSVVIEKLGSANMIVAED